MAAERDARSSGTSRGQGPRYIGMSQNRAAIGGSGRHIGFHAFTVTTLRAHLTVHPPLTSYPFLLQRTTSPHMSDVAIPGTVLPFWTQDSARRPSCSTRAATRIRCPTRGPDACSEADTAIVVASSSSCSPLLVVCDGNVRCVSLDKKCRDKKCREVDEESAHFHPSKGSLTPFNSLLHNN